MDRITHSVIDKLDLLFVVDNSGSMADEQEILEDALPQLVNALINPICVDPDLGRPTGDTSSLDGCDSGEPAFEPIRSQHIAVITTSLGSAGGVMCSPESGRWNESQNGRSRFVTRSREGYVVDTWNDQGFLAWDPSSLSHDPPAEDDWAMLMTHFQNQVTGVGQNGCGYSAPLEAWYRFLIDPEPPLDVVRTVDERTGLEVSTPVGIDELLLHQRAQFYRPDSLLVIVMVTDDDDCSIADRGLGWQVGIEREGVMPRSTSTCDQDPNDPCCMSCIQATWPAQCDSPFSDPKCQEQVLHTAAADPLNLRCFDQKRRFGMDLLHPLSRYVDGLQSHELLRRNGSLAPNPLYSASEAHPDSLPRLDSSLIFLIGIVGVPWQDIATDDTLEGDRLRYMTAGEINQRGLWDLILGDRASSPPVLPGDPFLIQSVEPRSGTNPRTGIAIEPPRDGPGGNPINGHEHQATSGSLLQHSCIFPLRTPRDCSHATPEDYCPCSRSSEVSSSPLCDGTLQVFAGARPAPRILQVLEHWGANSIVGSICPKNPVGEATDPNYGFNPVASAIIERLKPCVHRTCLPRPLAVEPRTGHVLCRAVEVTLHIQAAPCAGPGRAAVDPELAEAVERKMHELEMCGTTRPCEQYSMCEITQPPPGPELDSCLNDPDNAAGAAGFCYIDAMAEVDRNQDGERHCELYGEEGSAASLRREDCFGNPELVAECPPFELRDLRFVGTQTSPTPWPNSTIFVACRGDTFPQ